MSDTFDPTDQIQALIELKSTPGWQIVQASVGEAIGDCIEDLKNIDPMSPNGPLLIAQCQWVIRHLGELVHAPENLTEQLKAMKKLD